VKFFHTSDEAGAKSKFWYMVTRFLAGVGSFLVVLSISRITPSLVQSISGVRYGTIFIGAYLISRFKPSWFREDFGGWALAAKTAGTSLVIAGLVLAGLHGTG
jgi:hypothetical protein